MNDLEQNILLAILTGEVPNLLKEGNASDILHIKYEGNDYKIVFVQALFPKFSDVKSYSVRVA